MKDDLESKLSYLQLRPLPLEWRKEILGRVTSAEAPKPRLAPPRWLTVGWGLAWAAVIILHFFTPAEPRSDAQPAEITVEALHQRAELMQSLLAFK